MHPSSCLSNVVCSSSHCHCRAGVLETGGCEGDVQECVAMTMPVTASWCAATAVLLAPSYAGTPTGGAKALLNADWAAYLEASQAASEYLGNNLIRTLKTWGATLEAVTSE